MSRSCQVYHSQWDSSEEEEMPPVERDPKPGDLIEISRVGYQHWAVYVGNGYVVHLAPPSEVADAGASSIMSVFYERAHVRKDPLWEVAGKDSYRVNNKYDRQHEPLHPKEIVQRAKERVGEMIPYALTCDNCEHFVTELRYGVKISKQVDNALTYATVGGLAVLGVALVAAFTGSRNRRQHQ